MTTPTAIVSLADVKYHLNKTDNDDDTELQFFIDAATPVIENIAGPVLPQTKTEYFNGGVSQISVNWLPIVSVTSVTETYGQTNYTLTEISLGSSNSNFAFTVDYSTGRIVRRSFNAEALFPVGTNNVKVAYVAGRATIPANVRLATLMLIQHLWSTSQLNRGGGRPSLGGDDSFMSGAGFAVPNRVRELLQPSPRVPGVA